MSSYSNILQFLGIFISVLTTATCATLLFGMYRSKKLKHSSPAIAALAFSNGLTGAVCLPMWIYLTYDMNPARLAYEKLHMTYNFFDISLMVATTLQLVLISYEQLRIKAQLTFNSTGTSKWSLLFTWMVGIVAGLCHVVIRNSRMTIFVIVPALVLVPFILIVLCFIGMLLTKTTSTSVEQQFGATTKTGLTVLSCGLCFVPCMMAVFLFHADVLILARFPVEVLVLLRYLHVFLTTIIHGYKAVVFDNGELSGGDQGKIVQIYKNPSERREQSLV